MLVRPITYTDFNDNEVTETFHFHISKNEIVDLEVEHNEGMEEFIKRIVEADDKKALLGEFKRIILLAYGEKSEDGKRFIKSDELSHAFSQTAAFDTLFIEMFTSEDAAVNFIQGALPADISAPPVQDKPTGPPPVPSTQSTESV